MSESKKGRADLVKREERRQEVKELYLQGMGVTAIAKKVGSHIETVKQDIKYLQAYYTKLALNNPYIAERQVTRVEKLLDEVNMIKNEYYTLYKEIKEKVANDKTNKRKNKPLYYSTRMDILSKLMSRIESEAKLMNLFNPANLIKNNYIPIESMKQILLIVRGIIMELIPAEKRPYAIQRMKAIDVVGVDGEKIIDAEIVKE